VNDTLQQIMTVRAELGIHGDITFFFSKKTTTVNDRTADHQASLQAGYFNIYWQQPASGLLIKRLQQKWTGTLPASFF